MPEDITKIVIGSDGLPRAQSPHDWDMLPDADKASILAQWTKTWERGGSGASPTSVHSALVAPAVRKPFNADDHSIGDTWRPSPSELEGTKFNDWK